MPLVVSNGQIDYVTSGEIVTSATVDAGGYLIVLPGGVANATTVSGFAAQLVYGSASGTIVDALGFLEVYPGASANATTVESGGFNLTTVDVVSSGQTLGPQTVPTHEVINVSSGGIVENLTIQSGGSVFLSGGANASGLVISGDEQVNGTDVSATITAGAVQMVFAGGVTTGTRAIGGAVFTFSGGLAGGVSSSTAVGGGVQYVLSGGTATCSG
jgi:autotransporter passenger strand-loop-strand repeat protein